MNSINSLEISERAEKEKNRITEILEHSGVSEKKREMLIPIIENTAWMKIKLDDSRQTIKNSQIAINYDNGGGQRGIRENPLFKGYESLWKAYMQGMIKIIECMPLEMAAKETDMLNEQKSTLALIRSKHRKNA